MKPSDRYLKVVEWSPEDGCYVGTSPGLMFGGVHGHDEAVVYKDLCAVVEECLRLHAEDGDPLPPPTAGKHYSGKFVVRIGTDLHKRLAIEAAREGKSLNEYCVGRLRLEASGASPAGRRARTARGGRSGMKAAVK
ncbi:MAG: toxin-antitoxin system HicB family antitoxin [Planctomycetes bacterium]|nr:toxin-antitoxin system HicB family antitoxin [Planctomycetota bacterium]